MLWLLAVAAQVVAAAPLNPHDWFKADDMPNIATTGLWWVPVRVTVGPGGQVLGCALEAKSGVREFDALSCKLILARAKFRPASIDGVDSFGVYRTSVKWVIADQPWDISKLSNPDIDLEVNALPPGSGASTLVRVQFEVDAAGKLSSCRADDTKGIERADNNPDLVPLACEQVLSTFKTVPASNAGTFVPSVQNALVRFSLGRN